MCHPMPIRGGAGQDVRPVRQVTIATGAEGMPAYVSRPDGRESVPGLVIVSDIYGASHSIRRSPGASPTRATSRCYRTCSSGPDHSRIRRLTLSARAVRN